MDEFYSFEEYFSKASSRESKFPTDQIYINLVKKYTDKGKLIDVGCGTGNFLHLAKKTGFDVWGVEISAWASEYARKKRGLRVITGTLEETNFQKSFFDVATIFDVLEHVDDPLNTLKKINRILKSDGWIFLTVPNFYRIFWRLDPKKDDIFSKEHLYYFTPRTLSEMLSIANFKIVSIRTGLITNFIGNIFSTSGMAKGLVESSPERKRPRWKSTMLEFIKKIDKTPYGNSIEIVAKKL